ncbi:MAG TPA: hypothetical protein DCD97_06660 [Firmicutes bacterium]|jgi:hypothetical protein|nr:hypothetical protein [Bacillota bacterium]HAA34978.1 hypothetical protein [Bacillota bacterium]
MRFNLKWPVVIMVFLLTFASIYAVNYWRQQRLIKEPLKEALLEIEAVEDISIKNKQNTEILVTLGKVEDLSKTYKSIEEIMLLTYPENSFKITVIDRRNTYLESLYEKVHFSLMEGERLGNYTKMSKEVVRLLEQEQELGDYRLRVDQKRIYLQLAAGDNFLYEVVPLTFATEVNNA